MTAQKNDMVTAKKHREFRNDEFWKEIPGWSTVSRDEFADHMWQQKNAIVNVAQVKKVLGSRLSDATLADIEEGQKIAPMNIRITPYLFALMNWNDPINDPLRKQFLPVGSQFLPDHPFYMLDSLAEDEDSPVPLLTHRYTDKVLFLTSSLCPVYCAYCTRSRLVGGGTGRIEKDIQGVNTSKWQAVFDYVASHDLIEDVVISGGDAFVLKPDQLKLAGETFLKMPHIRRIRFATKGVAILPQKILTDEPFVQALTDVFNMGKSMGKQVMIHTHFSCSNEITEWSKMAMDRLFKIGITVRNQAVLQEGVNSNVSELVLLTKKLSYMNIQPLYVYLHDMVQGCEHLRTTVREAQNLEKNLRGVTAGYTIPNFVCDAPGGGGKRNIHSYEYYDEETGVSVWTAPNVKPGKCFTYFDPIHKLSKSAQARWADEKQRDQMVVDAKKKAGF